MRDVAFTAVIAGDEGRVAVAYLGTPDFEGWPDDAPPETRWHLYVSVSEDALSSNPTWRTARATSIENPAHLGKFGTRSGQFRELLDFIGISATPDGRVLVSYADGCPSICAGESTNGFGEVTVAVLDEGPRLVTGGGPPAERGIVATSIAAATPTSLGFGSPRCEAETSALSPRCEGASSGAGG